MSGASIALRPATADDCRAIAGIYAHHVLNGLASFETDPPDADEIVHRHLSITNAGLPYIVAEQDGAIRGYAYAAPYRPRPAYRYTVEDSVYVAPDAGGSGIGSLMLAYLIDDCTARGYRQMIAIIGDSANAPSIGLHAKHGFRKIGVLDSVGFKFGRWVDSVIMMRSLGGGGARPPDEA